MTDIILSSFNRIIRSITNNAIETAEYDVRHDLPEQFDSQFKTALTDPAYTVNGITAFAYRCWQATQADGVLFLSMPQVDPQSSGHIQLNLLHMGWTLREQHKNFNQYKGASVHAHVSSLFVWEKWTNSKEVLSNPILDYNNFYTAQQKSG